jgi:DEAD/DEAH box helicase domain-containing protein
VIDQDGAPFSGKDFVLWNPPLVDEAKAVRRSPNTDATFLFGDLLQQQVRTITFSGTRKVAELLYIYVRDRFRQEAPALADRVRPYRAGYLAEHRREIERGLFEGSLLGVSATNALELGIDIGDLDATVMTGYPGTIASTWQQAGRSGRRSERSLSVLVASDNPLDQYLMRHPEAFFERPQEHALISAANPHILQPHLLCAAYESPLTAKDGAIFGDAMWPLVQRLERRGLLQEGTGSRWFPSTDTLYPAEEVNIRSTAHRLYQVVEESSGTLLETMDSSRVYSQAHPGAVYLHQGDAYIVTRLDHQAGTAWVKAHAEPYYTVPRDHTEISIVKAASQAWVNGVRVSLGEVDVANTVVGFKRKRQFTEEVLDDEPLEMPTQSFVTVALWWDIPEPARVHVDRMGLDFEGGLHACEHAAIGMLPLFAMCDRADIGGVSTALHPDTGKPQIFIYDGHPGGIGIAEKGYELVAGLWEATLRTILECPCESGCPSCIQSPKCGNNNNPLDKTAAAIILEHLLDADSRPAAGRRSA